MITFQLRYDEHTMLWAYSPDGTRWSEPMRYAKATAAIGREIQRMSIDGNYNDLDKRWSMPLPHQARSKRSEAEKHAELMDRYEIRGGKVQKIGFTERERTAQQADEILALIEGLEP